MAGIPVYFAELETLLRRMGGSSYGAYRRLGGRVFRDRGLRLGPLRIQVDPFAPPSLFAVGVCASVTGFPDWALSGAARRVAAADFVHRRLYALCRDWSRKRGTGHSGELEVPRPCQEVLKRSAVTVTERGDVELTIGVGLPADGRRIRAGDAIELLCGILPHVALRASVAEHLNLASLRRHVETVEDAVWLREEIERRGLVAFVADGSVLPRQSGVDDRPCTIGVVIPFESPPSLRVTVELPNRGRVSGMGIPGGVTLIAGGAYHGKSTLLRAIERGIYNHVPGDGRELVVTCSSAVKVRAEDGRAVAGTDVANFVMSLPNGETTKHFVTAAASGSTSQAAAIIEALEVGTRCLLLDEDTSAANLLVRDARMQQLVPDEYEPITPLLDRVRYMWEELGISTILVVGGNGDYLDVADLVICMRAYRPLDVTQAARDIVRACPSRRRPVQRPWQPIACRKIVPGSVNPTRGKKKAAVRARGRTSLEFGTEHVDLSAVEQIVEVGQVQAIGLALARAAEELPLSEMSPAECSRRACELVAKEGFDWLDLARRSFLTEFRDHELAAALNRLRSLRTRPVEGAPGL